LGDQGQGQFIMNGELFCGTGRGEGGRVVSAGLAGATGLTATALAGTTGGEAAEVSLAVATWVEQLGQFLGVVQATLEQSRPREDATAEVRAVAGQLPALIRQCRAQVPTPDMIHTWVQTLIQTRGSAPERPAAGPAALNLPRQARSLGPRSIGPA
jgi:hypothetical protein